MYIVVYSLKNQRIDPIKRVKLSLFLYIKKQQNSAVCYAHLIALEK